jgi:hypothetical protein
MSDPVCKLGTNDTMEVNGVRLRLVRSDRSSAMLTVLDDAQVCRIDRHGIKRQIAAQPIANGAGAP